MIQTKTLKRKQSLVFAQKEKANVNKPALSHSNSRPKLLSKPKNSQENCDTINVAPKSKQALLKSKSVSKLHPNKVSLLTQKGNKNKETAADNCKKLKKSQSKTCLNYIDKKKQMCKPKLKQRNSIKTDYRSKNPSIYNEDCLNNNKRKLNPKIIKFKKPKQSKLQQQINNSVLYSATKQTKNQRVRIKKICSASECIRTEAANQENNRIEKNFSSASYCQQRGFKQKQNQFQRAAILIQKHFRGYIVRKYLQQAKYIIQKVTLIQRKWREYHMKNIKKSKKSLFIQSMPLTNTDVNQSIKSERQKFFQIKQNSLKKVDLKDLIKSIMQQQALSESIKQKVRKNVLNQERANDIDSEKVQSCNDTKSNREQYIQQKISKQIQSQRVFHSPCKHDTLVTPKNSSSAKKQTSLTKSNFFKAQKNTLVRSPSSSPSIFQLSSPKLPQRLPQRTPLFQPTEQLQVPCTISGFDTSFQFIQQFSVHIIDFLSEDRKQKQAFINNLQQLRNYKWKLIFRNWNQFVCRQDDSLEQGECDFFYRDSCQQPDVFSNMFRMKVLSSPTMRIFLQDSKYNVFQAVLPNSQLQGYYIGLIFDGLCEAVFSRFYPSELSAVGEMNAGHLYRGKDLYNTVMTHALWRMYEWAGTLCGSSFNQTEMQEWMQPVNQQRMDSMVKQLEPFGFLGHVSLLIVVETAQFVFATLLAEMQGVFL